MKLRALAVTTLLAAGALAAGPAAAEGAGALQLAGWQADPAGRDTRTNASINGEYIQVRNTSARAVAVAGYSVRDAHGFRFVFPRGSVVKARSTVTIRTGRGTNTATTFYWNQANHVWNNTGDTATLSTPGKVVQDTCTYRRNGTGRTTC